MVTPDATVLNATKYTLTMIKIRNWRLTSFSPIKIKLTGAQLQTWSLILTVKLNGFIIMQETNLWVYLWGYFQRDSTEIGRPAVNMCWALYWIKKVQKRKWTEHSSVFIYLCFPAVDTVWSAALDSCYHAILITTDCVPSNWRQNKVSLLNLPLTVFCHSNVKLLIQCDLLCDMGQRGGTLEEVKSNAWLKRC